MRSHPTAYLRGGSMIDALTSWATDRDDVRAMILTSTRAVPGAELDAYSDYDVIIVVDAVRPWVEDHGWLADFGEVLLAYWDPVQVDPVTGTETVGNITNYRSGLKIDFSLWPTAAVPEIVARPDQAAELDAGHRVLVDKDGLTSGWPAPTFRAYVPERPDRATFERLVTDFLIGVPYVAKGLLRDELLPMKWVLDFDMRHNYLVPLLWWRVECDHDWQLTSGNLGRGLRRHLDERTWTELEATFVGTDPEANWSALFAMVALFDRIATEVAEALGYPAPSERIAAVVAHAHAMRAGSGSQ